MKKCLTLLAAALSAFSCIYPFTPETGVELDGETIVVDGTVLIGEKTRVNVRRMAPLVQSQSGSVPARDLATQGYIVDVWLEDDRGTVYPATFNQSAHEIDTRNAPEDRRYRLHLRIYDPEGTVKNYLSSWEEVAHAPEVDEVLFSADDSRVSVHVDAHADTVGPAFYRFDYSETWEFQVMFDPDYYYDVYTRRILEYPDDWVNPYHYCWSSHTPNEPVLYNTLGLSSSRATNVPITGFPRTNDRCQILYSIDIRTMGMSRASYEYHAALLKNSNLTGDLFTATPSEIRGNVTCVEDSTALVLGYVSATTLKTRRAFMDGRYYRMMNHDAEFFFPDLEDMTYGDYYTMGFRPASVKTLVSADGVSQTGVAWVSERCINCVAAGGTKTKPDYWPNNHE